MAQSPGKGSLVRADFFLGQCPKFGGGRPEFEQSYQLGASFLIAAAWIGYLGGEWIAEVGSVLCRFAGWSRPLGLR